MAHLSFSRKIFLWDLTDLKVKTHYQLRYQILAKVGYLKYPLDVKNCNDSKNYILYLAGFLVEKNTDYSSSVLNYLLYKLHLKYQ